MAKEQINVQSVTCVNYVCNDEDPYKLLDLEKDARFQKMMSKIQSVMEKMAHEEQNETEEQAAISITSEIDILEEEMAVIFDAEKNVMEKKRLWEKVLDMFNQLQEFMLLNSAGDRLEKFALVDLSEPAKRKKFIASLLELIRKITAALSSKKGLMEMINDRIAELEQGIKNENDPAKKLKILEELNLLRQLRSSLLREKILSVRGLFVSLLMMCSLLPVVAECAASAISAHAVVNYVPGARSAVLAAGLLEASGGGNSNNNLASKSHAFAVYGPAIQQSYLRSSFLTEVTSKTRMIYYMPSLLNVGHNFVTSRNNGHNGSIFSKLVLNIAEKACKFVARSFLDIAAIFEMGDVGDAEKMLSRSSPPVDVSSSSLTSARTTSAFGGHCSARIR